jgi:uncharacterized protein YndB with AHSA1/START domain
MTDYIRELNAVDRALGRATIPAGEARTIVLRRSYDASIEDVWDALTDAERIGRWLTPIAGDLRLGGKYQLEGNAGGEILACDPPKLLRVTWVYGENVTEADISEVEVRLSPAGPESTLFEMEHAAVVPAEMWGQFGPGAVGVGWDLALLGLGLHLSGGSVSEADKATWHEKPEGREFIFASSEAWGEANKAAGATEADATAAVAATTAFYAPEPQG